MAKITVDGKVYPTKTKALKFFLVAMMACEGSEGARMSFAYTSIAQGYRHIDTYEETAEK